MSEIDPYEEDQVSSHTGSINSQEDWDLELGEGQQLSPRLQISSLTRPSGLATESTSNTSTTSTSKKKKKNKQNNKNKRKRKQYVPINSALVIYGHHKNLRDKKANKDACSCLSHLTKDSNWLMASVDAVRQHIRTQVSEQFGSESHISYVKELLNGINYNDPRMFNIVNTFNYYFLFHKKL